MKEKEEVIITWLEEETEVTQEQWDVLISSNEGSINIPVPTLNTDKDE